MSMHVSLSSVAAARVRRYILPSTLGPVRVPLAAAHGATRSLSDGPGGARGSIWAFL